MAIKVFVSYEGLPTEFPSADSYTISERGHLIVRKGEDTLAIFADGVWVAAQALDGPAA